MTGVGMCGIFIPDRVQASPSGANRKESNRLGVGGTTACWGRGWYIRHSDAGKIPKENTLHIKQGESLKSRIKHGSLKNPVTLKLNHYYNQLTNQLTN